MPSQLQHRQWIYSRHPGGLVAQDHYALRSEPLSLDISTGEVLVQAEYISVDPYMRINQSKKPTYNSEPHPLGVVQSAGAVGRVLVSDAPDLPEGTWVEGMLGWQTHARAHASTLRKLDLSAAPVSSALGVLGMPGRTAWFGLTDAGRPHAGEVVVVSGAAGAVGSLVVQFARKHGCRVLGIAGGAAKTAWLTETLGADWALDYKAHDTDSLAEAIRALTGGVDVYFDNVGGWISDAVLPLINRRARIVICGQISQYSGGLDVAEMGPRLLQHLLYQRATMQGMLARDYVHRMDEMIRIVAPWVRDQSLLSEETIIDGFEHLPDALTQLFTGDHRGKLLVRVEV